MSFTLVNFEEHIDETILGRGQHYFGGGRVIGLGVTDDSEWYALVDGTVPYRVTILKKPDGTLDWQCDCPYEYGPVCKHVVAALYAIRAAQSDEATPSPGDSSKRKKRKTHDEQIREAIASLSYEELQDLVVELSGHDREISHMILTRYSVPEGGRKASRRLVKEALGLYQGRHGFLDYHGAANAGRAVWRLVDRAGTLLENSQTEEALFLYQAILEETCVALGQADDSMGMLGACPAGAVEGLRDTIPHLSSAGRRELFEYCLATGASQPVADWDWGWDLIELATLLMKTPEQRAALFAALDQLATSGDDQYGPSEYHRSRAAELKLAVIEQEDGRAAMLPFMQAHIEHEKIRERLAHYYIEDGDLEAARRVCEEWLEHPVSYKPGLRKNFLQVLLTISDLQGDSGERLRATEALFFDTGEMELFRQMKALVGAETWPAYRKGFFKRLQAVKTWRVRPDMIYVEEAMWPDLLAFVQRHSGTAEQHHAHLAGRFPRELAAVYEQLAIEALARNMSRAGYHKAAAYLLKMVPLGAQDQAMVIVTRWRHEHKNRPALQDELDKAFG